MTSKCHVVQFLVSYPEFWVQLPKKHPNRGELDVEGAAGHPRSRDGAGRSERRLARSTAREVEKSDCEVRFSARPSLPELEVALPSLHSTSVVCSCGIPRSERGISRLPLLHCHHHTPHSDTAIPYARVLSVSGRWSCPKPNPAHRRERDSPFLLYFGALTVRRTRRMNDHRIRGSHHDPKPGAQAI